MRAKVAMWENLMMAAGDAVQESRVREVFD
jgi:hypothetical protein